MIKSAQDYHTATSYHRHDMSGHFLDWSNQPQQFKDYPLGPKVILPKAEPPADKTLWSIWGQPPLLSGNTSLTVDKLSQLLGLGHTLTSRAGQTHLRSAASAGALYPNEIYVGVYHVSGLDEGIYHFDLRHHSLTCLRPGNFKGFVDRASDIADPAPLVASLFISGIFYRSAWKYRARAYRYVLLDAGHILSNFLLATKVMGYATLWQFAFNDEAFEHLLGINPKKEGIVACVHLLGQPNVHPETKEIKPLGTSFTAASQTAAVENTYDEIRQIHTQCKTVIFPKAPLTDMAQRLGCQPPTWQPIQKIEPFPAYPNYLECVLKRRSRRNFIPEPLSLIQLHQLLNLMGHHWRHPRQPPVNYRACLTVGLWVNSVETLDPGFYLIDLIKDRIGLVKTKRDQGKVAAFCLNQDCLKNGAAYIMFMTNMADLDLFFGPRGYRYAMLAAGEIGQTLYLGATAQGLGCCGIGAIYDEEARRFLGLNIESVLLYLLAVGPVKSLPSV